MAERGEPSEVSPLCAVSAINSSVESKVMGTEIAIVGRARSLWRAYTKGSVLSSIFILLTTCIGAGTLSLPYAFAQGGLVVSSVIFFLIMVISVHVGNMLFSGKRYCAEVYPGMEVWSYEDLAQATFGAIGKIAVLLTLFLLLFLALIAYMIYTRDQLDAIVHFALMQTGHNPLCSPLVNCAVLMCISFLPIFPITLLRNLTPLQGTSYLSILCIAYVAVVMTIKTAIAWPLSNHNHTNASSESHVIQLGPTGLRGVVTVISYCSLAFVCHFNLLPLQKEFSKPLTQAKRNTIVIGSVVIAYALYNVVIFAGYFNFFGKIRQDVMLSYPRNDVLVTTARAALFLMLLFSYPVLLHPTRGAINRLVLLLKHVLVKTWDKRKRKKGEEWVDSYDENIKIPTIVWFCETWLLFAASFLPASFISDVGVVWNFVGSIGGILVLYIYPAAFYLRLRYLRYQRRVVVSDGAITVREQYTLSAVGKEVIAWIILALGLVLLVVANYQAIAGAIDTPGKGESGMCLAKTCHYRNFSSSADHFNDIYVPGVL